MASKIILTGQEAVAKLKEGVEKVYKAASKTLGPKSYGALFVLGGKEEYESSNDGYRLLKEIHLQDPIEDLAAKSMRDTCSATNEQVGDGTTTSVVLAHSIFNAGYKKAFPDALLMGNKISPIQIKEQILEEADLVFQELKKQTKPLENDEDIENVAFVASNSKEIATLVGDIYKKNGRETSILVEESNDHQTSSEIVEGIEIPNGYIARELGSKGKENMALFEQSEGPVKILFTNFIINQPSQLIPLAEKLVAANIRRVVICARAFTREVYPTLKANAMTGNMHILAIDFPASDYGMEDYALATGGVFYDEVRGMKLEDTKLEDLGEAKKVISYPNDLQNRTFIIGGKGDRGKVAFRIQMLRDEIKKERLNPIKEKLRKRLGAISGGLGIIRIGGGTRGKRTETLRKIEDTVNATRVAIEQGIVPGGGLVFKKISDALPKDSILKEALLAPYEIIQENAGGNLKIAKNVYDPAQVSETAFRNAVECATSLLTTGIAIANEATPDFLKILDQYFKDHPLNV